VFVDYVFLSGHPNFPPNTHPDSMPMDNTVKAMPIFPMVSPSLAMAIGTNAQLNPKLAATKIILRTMAETES